MEATPVTWRRPQQLEATEELREKLASVRRDKRRRDGASQTVASECDINDGAVSERGHVTSDDVTPDHSIMTRDPGEELLSLASTASGPLYLNKAELMRYGQVRPGRASLVMSPTQQRQEVR